MALQKQICFALFTLVVFAQCILTKCSASIDQQPETPINGEELLGTLYNVGSDVYDEEDSLSPATVTVDHDDIIKDEPIKRQYPEFSHNATHKRDILIISTMDGMITALDTGDDGKVLWQLQTGPGSLLSSSISKVELNSEGKLIRLIPSLNGALYKFDGEGVEPIQMSADSLLHTSYLAADDLLITGGKEIQTYGVDATTGHLQYTCASNGCHIEPIETTSEGDFLVFRRHSQVVRAIEPRSGVERWNFSVGRHEATVLQTDVEVHLQTINLKPNDCFPVVETSLKENAGNDRKDQASVKFKVDVVALKKLKNANVLTSHQITVSDGVVNAFFSNAQGNLWKHKFESSIAHAWHLKDGKIVSLDTFDTDNIPSVYDSDMTSSRPLLYVGLHNHQLYVQESSRFSASLLNPGAAGENSLAVQSKKFYWHPDSANELYPHDADKFIKLISGPPAPPLIASGENNDNCSDGKSNALAVRPNSHPPPLGGMFFYEKVSDQSTTEEPMPATEPEEELWEGGKDTTVHIVIVSLWFWWREVVLISLVTALVFHVFITRQVVKVLQTRWIIEFQKRTSAMNLLPLLDRRTNNPQTIVPIEDANQTPNSRETVETSPEVQTLLSSSSEPVIAPYVSRYLTDFEPIQCLGRGGFGVVFEVRNRLDDCHYAVKRIQLPNTEAARQKVMREVKALAKLDNPHIVRYFHAWIECPPPGWQESQDARLFIEFGETLTDPTPCNTGEEESSYNESKSIALKTDTFSSNGKLPSFSKMLKSIDEARRDLTSPDDSLDIVFENSDDEGSSDSENDEERVVFEDSDSDDGIVFEHSQNEDENSVTGGSSRRELAVDLTSSDLSHGNQSSSASSDAVLERNSGSHSRNTSLSVSVKKKKSSETKRAKNSAKESRMYLYIQMQLCRKESLREWLRAQVSEPDINHVLHMFNDIVRAVEYVHLQGMIHRDLKPSNIFFAPDGSVKIGDFGLVTAMAEEAYMLANDGHRAGCSPILENHTDQVGTQLYMSPEQIEGKPYNYKVDIYSLGLILFELLWPLSTQMEQVVTLTRLRDLKLPVGFDDKFPQEGNLLRKMLSRNPDERPTTFGIRASAPLLRFQDISQNPIPEHMHYDLQRPRRITE